MIIVIYLKKIKIFLTKKIYNLNIYKNERILSSDLKCSSLIEIPHSNETRVKKEENPVDRFSKELINSPIFERLRK